MENKFCSDTVMRLKMNAIETFISDFIELSKDKYDVEDILDILLKNLDPYGQMSPYYIYLKDETLQELSKVYYPKERSSYPHKLNKEAPCINKIKVTSGDIIINTFINDKLES